MIPHANCEIGLLTNEMEATGSKFRAKRFRLLEEQTIRIGDRSESDSQFGAAHAGSLPCPPSCGATARLRATATYDRNLAVAREDSDLPGASCCCRSMPTRTNQRTTDRRS